MKRILLFAALISGFAGLPSSASAAGAGGPLDQLKASNDRIERLLKGNRKDDQAARAEMKAIVNGFLDYDELARRSLANHWETLGKPQREQFVSTLRELIEKNYVKQLRTNLEYEVRYENEQITEGEALVSTMVKVRTKGKSTDTEIAYKLRKVGEKWLVFDVITDDVSMVKNYKSQFNKIITNEGFDALLKKMRTRIAETDDTKADGKAGSVPLGSAPKSSKPGDQPAEPRAKREAKK